MDRSRKVYQNVDFSKREIRGKKTKQKKQLGHREKTLRRKVSLYHTVLPNAQT